MKKYLLAVDPGQKQDPAAIQLYMQEMELVHGVELLDQPDRVLLSDLLIYQWRIQDRRYTDLARFVVDIMDRQDLKEQTVLVLDATGVGTGVKDMLYSMGVKDMIPIVYTAGGKVSYVYRDTQDKRFKAGQHQALDFHVLDEIHVPKSDLVDEAVIALEQRRVKIPRGVPYKDDFERQMVEFTGKMNARGYMSYNNSDDEIHDDFVNCLMMRSWVRRQYKQARDLQEGPWHKPQTMADFGIFKTDW